MKRIITFFAGLLVLSSVIAQNTGNPSECDSVDIVSIGYNPFDIAELLVYVQNHNQLEIFDYPGFKLLNTNNDTVAEETVNFFGIGTESLHQLNTTLSGYLPGDVFNGELLLYSGFYDSLRCVFPVSDTLVPDGGCSEFYISTTDWSENIMQSLYWSITDEQGSTVASGEHDHTSTEFTLYDTLCLPNNNCYTLNITANNPIEGNSDIALNYLGFWISVGNQMQQGSTLYELDFSVYYCDSVLSVGETEAQLQTIELKPNPASDQLYISWVGDYQTIEVFDIAGKKVRSLSITQQQQKTIDISDLQNGIYTLSLINDKGAVAKKFIKSGQ